METKSLDIINANIIEHRFIEARENIIEPEHISEITAVFTTANARLRLYDMLTWLDPSQIIYCDTDPCQFRYDPNNPKHKFPSNDAPDLPATVRFGDGLGQWKDELNGGFINEEVVGGAKSYAYIVKDGETKIETILDEEGNPIEVKRKNDIFLLNRKA